MDHNIINLQSEAELTSLVLYQKDNNLDKRDNLDELPETAAVYAVCGRVNGEPANPRYVGVVDNLRDAIKGHFDKSRNDVDQCFKDFVLSIKTKTLIYQELDGSNLLEREKIRDEWDKKFKPQCNEVLNKVH